MDHAIYTAMGGASQTLAMQAVTTANLANVSTPGFRAQLSAFRAVPVNGPSLPTRILVTASTPGADMSAGKLDYTERPLDVATEPDAWLAIRMADGSEAYTRNGNMQLDPQGMLTIAGHPVMGEDGPIALPQNAKLTIAADGSITALNPGDQPNATVQVARLKLVSGGPATLVRSDDGFFRPSRQVQQQSGPVLAEDPNLRVMPGVLEGSNVNPAEAMVSLISQARQFEMQMKEISSVDQNEQKANQLLSLNS
ncbi:MULTISPECIES: flagellar basal body rod protein FlgF [unclassified Tatumella]|uniref:flagellar basal body rod protein FlgF n=1 Tax=unclassified Tatumella TaxID=2649542 RepID=UPI001BAE7974|nr:MULTISPECIES: flagellar basal body rod protein FlgF [unclassified Tatumella]MBS0856907.1 flagellar basal body rod protein FlgF [Tatumella sp. JGM16]MBS0913650.1 flagellar basal body rod protein FlgF [Tatumella sp. JGM91]